MRGKAMKIKVVVHDAEEGGYWAEVPAIPGCATQGDTFEALLASCCYQIRNLLLLAGVLLRQPNRNSLFDWLITID